MKTLLKFKVIQRKYIEHFHRGDGYILTLLPDDDGRNPVDNVHNTFAITLVLSKEEGEKYSIGTEMELVTE